MKKLTLYALALTLPAVLAAAVVQAVRYDGLRAEVRRLNTAQEELVEANKRLVSDIAALSSPERVANLAETELGLSRKKPEEVLQIRVERPAGLGENAGSDGVAAAPTGAARNAESETLSGGEG